MYFNELNVHTVEPSMTPRERLMTYSLGTTAEYFAIGNFYIKL